MATEYPISGLVPVISRPIQLSPVGLKEAALDSPSFRASTFHYSDQVDALERWLESYLKAITKLSHEVSFFENLITAVASTSIPPSSISEAVIDHDYTLLAAQRYSDIAKTFWQSAIAGLKKLDTNMVEPIRQFLQNDLRNFKNVRRELETTQRHFDQLSARYASQLQGKEASAFREDAFQLHEARRAYLKASLDFAIAAPQLRTTLDKVLVKAFQEQGQKMWRSQNPELARWTAELERIRGWARELEAGEKASRKDMQVARRGIEQSTEAMLRPSRELSDYSQPSAPSSLLAKGPVSALPSSKPKSSEKQGWLYVKTFSGRPARTLWIRRWFYVKNGIFACLVQGSRSGGVEESERIGVLLCGIRPAAQEERRFCFEVKTKDTTIVLQAESQLEMVEWMSTFDLAKQRALQDPASTDAFSSSRSDVLDPAFAISNPTAPEFTASITDVGVHAAAESEWHDRNTSLTLPPTDTMSSLHRNSFDVTTHRRSTAFEKETESKRDRLMQKLDLSKTSTGLSSGPPPGSGIASLISATHASMPVGPGTISSQPAEQPTARVSSIPNRTAFLARTLAPNSLAPSTLVNPPTATNLSATAVSVSGERGIGVGTTDTTGGMPSGILANLWGSSNWGAVNRFERGEVKNAPPQSATSKVPTSQRQDVADTTESMPQPAASEDVAISRKHRKTISLDGDQAELQRAAIPTSPTTNFPPQYPIQLKHQDAQFRLLFPDVDPNEKLVLVFRATWVPNEQQEFPGRAYLTPKHIFFYSNHLGLVLVTGFSLDRITDVTSAPGRDCDFLFLHMRASNDPDFARITIKTFLSELRLLQRRIDFILQNYAEGSNDLEAIMKRLVDLENEPERRDSSDSFEEFQSVDTLRRHSFHRHNKDLRTKILVDQGLSMEIKNRPVSQGAAFKFKLPNRPITYVPRGFENPTVERTYNISPKALYHVLFGDRSAVFQLAYLEQEAQNLRQGPWQASEQGNLRREFQYTIAAPNLIGLRRKVSVSDSQLVDVSNDHLLYVVTDRKTPSHLPHPDSYKLLSKIVITHETKSKSKLAIYVGIEWRRRLVVGALLERYALADLRRDACYVAEIVAEQVEKLGIYSNTKRAVQIFGPVGQQTETLEFQNIANDSKRKRSHPRRRWTIWEMLFTAISNIVANFIASVVALSLGMTRATWRMVNAHRILLVVFAFSVLANFLLTSREVWAWRQQYNARWYMGRLGVGKDLVMDKVVGLDEIEEAVMLDGLAQFDVQQNQCVESFRAAEASETTSTPELRQLRRSRQRLGRYRHDLMVAIRVVNRVETEIVRAGWEDWVVGEVQRCEGMGRLLAQQNDTQAGAVKVKLHEYCESCREAGGDVVLV